MPRYLQRVFFRPAHHISLRYTFIVLSQGREWVTREKLAIKAVIQPRLCFPLSLEELMTLEVHSRVGLITMFFLEVS